jgi:hypothetical protein
VFAAELNEQQPLSDRVKRFVTQLYEQHHSFSQKMQNTHLFSATPLHTSINHIHSLFST